MLGIYHYKGLYIFADFNINDYINRKLNSSAAHIYTNDLYQGLTNNLFKKNNNVELIYSPNSAEIIDAMSSVDLAISASGQTLYELACIGVPTVAVGIIDNQKNNIKNWINLGFIEYAGCWNNKNLLDNILEKIIIIK